jgi:hypothetical protein
MAEFWPYIDLILGSLFGFVLLWVSHRLSVKKEREKEHWIRRLNSYQDFYQHTMHLIDLLQAGIELPEPARWDAITLARKAAYDARLL